MDNLLDFNEVWKYKLGIIQQDRSIKESGELEFIYISNKLNVVIKINSKMNDNILHLTIEFDKQFRINSIKADGINTNIDYFFDAIRSRNNLKIVFKTKDNEIKQTQSMPKEYFENNTLMFLLFKSINKKSNAVIQVFNPTTSSFVTTRVDQMEITEKHNLNNEEIECIRYKVQPENQSMKSQFFIYDKKYGRLIKAICGKIIFELQSVESISTEG